MSIRFTGFSLRVQIAVLIAAVILLSCVPGDPWEGIQKDCNSIPQANISIAELRRLCGDGFYLMEEDYYLEGYVVSSDRAGNIFNTIFIQDRVKESQHGIAIALDLLNSHSIYPLGVKIIIRVKGLYLRVRKGMYNLGAARTLFGNLVLANIPANLGSEIMLTRCETVNEIEALELNLDDINESHLQQLIALDKVQFSEGLPGIPMAVKGESTAREITDCTDGKIVVRNSGFSDFADFPIPPGNGQIKGILVKRSNKFEIVINAFEDLKLDKPRCE